MAGISPEFVDTSDKEKTWALLMPALLGAHQVISDQMAEWAAAGSRDLVETAEANWTTRTSMLPPRLEDLTWLELAHLAMKKAAQPFRSLLRPVRR